MKLKFKTYKLKSEVTHEAKQLLDTTIEEKERFKAKRMLGVVAQDLEADGIEALVQEGEDGFKAVKLSLIYLKGMVALQETIKRVEQLEAQVQSLMAA